MGFDVKVSFVSCLIRLYNKPGDIAKEFWEKAIQFHGTFRKLQTEKAWMYKSSVQKF